MLRRKPTAITLTTEDIAIYEDARAREDNLREQAALDAQKYGKPIQQNMNQNLKDPNDEIRPLPGDIRERLQQQKTREERLGLAGGSSRN